ncbi:MAG: LytTR family transcriptional regulator, partial [Rhodobacterales bacterium CG_4_10_14_0_8_um_filter_70_9]
ALGPLAVVGPQALTPALRAPKLVEGRLTADALRAGPDGEATLTIAAFGMSDEDGARRLGQAPAAFAPDATEARATFDLPLELRNRVDRLAVAGVESAGAVALADEGVRRRRAGLVSGGAAGEGQRLVSDLHYLRAALSGVAESVEGEIETVLAASPDVVFLADVGRVTEAEAAALTEWTESGGLLVRFAGPRLARGADALTGGQTADDPLLPVRLRAGGRAVGGAMAWGEPQQVRAFAPDTPFAGLTAPRDVTVSRQILAQIGPELSGRTWAALEDGTPLVTAAPLGAGRVALFHVTANAEWSSLPLSGLFVEMIGRLMQLSGGGAALDRAALAGGTARPVALLDGFGRLADAQAAVAAPVERLNAPPGPDAPPGVYEVGGALIAYNLFEGDAALTPLTPPEGAARETLGGRGETPLAHWLLALALMLLAADTVAALALSGRLPRKGAGAAARVGAALLALALAAPPQARAADLATDDARALSSSLQTTFAHVLTGDAGVDRLALGGLRGLAAILTARTAIEPGEPASVNLETDALAFYPILYWPITPSQPTPSDEAITRLNAYMRGGGMIVFDTRDRHLDVGGGASPNTAALRRLTARLDLPPLEAAPFDHVLTRAFYLLEEFPGRFTGGRVWVEAAPDPDAAAMDGAPFRALNDGVSPVVVGSVDWAAAWAVDEQGQFLAPVAGPSGWRQREMAYRFGVNLVMYALTGNYKSDQVHVPALLERLGQ